MFDWQGTQTQATHLLPLWNAKPQIRSLVCTLRNSNITVTSLKCTLCNSNCAIWILIQIMPDNYFPDSLRKILKYEIIYQPRCHQWRARRALKLFKDVPLRSRRAISLQKVYGKCALLVLNGTSHSVKALLVLNGTSWHTALKPFWFSLEHLSTQR